MPNMNDKMNEQQENITLAREEKVERELKRAYPRQTWRVKATGW